MARRTKARFPQGERLSTRRGWTSEHAGSSRLTEPTAAAGRWTASRAGRAKPLPPPQPAHQADPRHHHRGRGGGAWRRRRIRRCWCVVAVLLPAARRPGALAACCAPPLLLTLPIAAQRGGRQRLLLPRRAGRPLQLGTDQRHRRGPGLRGRDPGPHPGHQRRHHPLLPDHPARRPGHRPRASRRARRGWRSWPTHRSRPCRPWSSAPRPSPPPSGRAGWIPRAASGAGCAASCRSSAR